MSPSLHKTQVQVDDLVFILDVASHLVAFFFFIFLLYKIVSNIVVKGAAFKKCLCFSTGMLLARLWT